MDEPFASLDAMTRNHLQEELMKLHQKEKVTVIFITHNIQEAVCLGTRILVMAKQGGIKMDVPNTEFRNRSHRHRKAMDRCGYV